MINFSMLEVVGDVSKGLFWFIDWRVIPLKVKNKNLLGDKTLPVRGGRTPTRPPKETHNRSSMDSRRSCSSWNLGSPKGICPEYPVARRCCVSPSASRTQDRMSLPSKVRGLSSARRKVCILSRYGLKGMLQIRAEFVQGTCQLRGLLGDGKSFQEKVRLCILRRIPRQLYSIGKVTVRERKLVVDVESS